MTRTQMRPRAFGEILDGAFQIVRQHYGVLGITSALPLLGMAVLNVILISSMGDPTSAGPLIALPLMLVTMLLMFAAWAALAWQTSEAWIGGHVGVGDGYAAAGRCYFRLLGAGFLAYLMLWAAMMVVMVPVGIVAAIAIPAMASSGSAAGVVGGVVAIGMFLGMILAGFVGGGALACTLPAVVVEGLGPIRAISRSIALSRGALLRTGAVVFVSVLIAFLPAMGIMLLTGQFSGMMQPQAAPPSTGALVVQQLGSVLVSSFTIPFMVAVVTVVYYDRRVRQEALDVQLAADHLPNG